MPHFMIVLILYINLLNLSLKNNVYFWGIWSLEQAISNKYHCVCYMEIKSQLFDWTVLSLKLLYQQDLKSIIWWYFWDNFLHSTIKTWCGYSSEGPHWGASNEYRRFYGEVTTYTRIITNYSSRSSDLPYKTDLGKQWRHRQETAVS